MKENIVDYIRGVLILIPILLFIFLIGFPLSRGCKYVYSQIFRREKEVVKISSASTEFDSLEYKFKLDVNLEYDKKFKKIVEKNKNSPFALKIRVKLDEDSERAHDTVFYLPLNKEELIKKEIKRDLEIPFGGEKISLEFTIAQFEKNTYVDISDTQKDYLYKIPPYMEYVIGELLLPPKYMMNINDVNDFLIKDDSLLYILDYSGIYIYSPPILVKYIFLLPYLDRCEKMYLSGDTIFVVGYKYKSSINAVKMVSVSIFNNKINNHLEIENFELGHGSDSFDMLLRAPPIVFFIAGRDFIFAGLPEHELGLLNFQGTSLCIYASEWVWKRLEFITKTKTYIYWISPAGVWKIKTPNFKVKRFSLPEEKFEDFKIFGKNVFLAVRDSLFNSINISHLPLSGEEDSLPINAIIQSPKWTLNIPYDKVKFLYPFIMAVFSDSQKLDIYYIMPDSLNKIKKICSYIYPDSYDDEEDLKFEYSKKANTLFIWEGKYEPLYLIKLPHKVAEIVEEVDRFLSYKNESKRDHQQNW